MSRRSNPVSFETLPAFTGCIFGFINRGDGLRQPRDERFAFGDEPVEKHDARGS
jgi:hypothetical protein